jgi:phosphate:Na+ symporter
METEDIIDAVDYTLELTFKAFRDDDVSLAIRVDPLSEVIYELKEIIKSHHVERLQEGTCSIEGGVSLFDLVNSFERIASHAANIALHVIKKVLKDLVDNEDKHNPLTDDELVDALSSKGYKVARRTIAKYRAQLDIPKARMMRNL